MRRTYKLLIQFISLFFCLSAIAQYKDTISLERKIIPVIRHSDNSKLPDSIHIIGHLADAPVRGACGVYCIGGTIKVELKNTIPGYNLKFVYLVTACLRLDINNSNEINVVASKLKNKESECYYNSIMNIFDSEGIPFYKLSEKETAKIH